MKGYTMKQIMSSDFIMPTDRQQIEYVYRTLAKSADMRLVRLEKVVTQENFRNAKKWAYDRAMRDIKAWSGEGTTRFNTKPPKTMEGLLSKIEDIKTFLSSKSSTKEGLKEILQKRADTLNKRYGTDFRWDEVGDFFESRLNDKAEDIFGSKTKVMVVGVIQRNKKDIESYLHKKGKKQLYLPDVDSEQLQLSVMDLLKNQKRSVRKSIYEYLGIKK